MEIKKPARNIAVIQELTIFVKKIMNSKAANIPANYKQVLKLVKQLPPKDKIRLSKELAKETIETRLNRLLHSFRTDELDENDINEEVEKVRTQIHDHKQKA